MFSLFLGQLRSRKEIELNSSAITEESQITHKKSHCFYKDIMNLLFVTLFTLYVLKLFEFI